ncbi:hypothetical protein SEUBUCD646_0B05830 [Saccharomyces eubayanus]|uniref:Vacuolar protein sorting-associated protein 72 n=2 Tax=Saccharomyces TaxID=4930 RepID=A0A6C1E488_SACPS|nr:Vacuolar protein sorting-associated protein 72 [Saccharomyces pastorianus]CAI1861462.1 hypothetical protein SEUBUCD650_0B05830 [Saccharomyces eubayanus]CAI1895621.1 hypothetical protein SEUBUCD646_0B05830 [Saccharomyces eubayanus]
MSFEDSDDDDDLGSGTEFIMQSRSRRSNAGNKLQKLLQQELKDIESTKRQLSSYNNGEDDDEDEIGLLFQEDEDDQDFEIVEKDDNEEGEEEEEDEDEAESITKGPTKTSSDQAADDLMFSSSESEGSNNDEDDDDAEEREIRKQELLSRKKRNKKLQKGPVIVKKQKSKVEPAREQATKGQTPRRSHHNHEQLNAETLLSNTRRTSKRSSVMENTMKVYEKLSKAEKKRKVIQERIRKHKEQEAKYILTQAERLRIAKETEKLNILSLDKFKEQEIWKKENRLALQKRQKLKFQPNETILQFLSTAWLMTPLMELDDRKYWQEQLSKRDKKKKKYPRKPKKTLGSNQPDAPDAKKGVSEVSVKEEDNTNRAVEKSSNDKQTTTTGGEIPSTNEKVVEETLTEAPIPTAPSEEPTTSSTPEITLDATTGKQATNDVTTNNLPEEDIVDTVDIITSANDTQTKDTTMDDLTNTLRNKETGPTDSSRDDKTAFQNENELLTSPQRHGTPTEDAELTSKDFNAENEILLSVKHENTKNSSVSPSHDSDSGSNTLKQVTFTDSPQVAIIDTEESPSKTNTTNMDSSSTENPLPTPVYEGPEQLTSRNFVTIYDFPNTPPNLKDFDTNLFGSQWSHMNATSTTQRSQDIQTIFHSILPSPSQLSVPSSSNVGISHDLSALANFPSFGEYDKKIIHEINTETNKDLEIKIKTQPPTGVFLANGIRKKCLITNKECQYFDPRTGVPYSDVEAYKIIQQIQDPIPKEEETTDTKRDETINDDTAEAADHARFKWFGFKNGGIYLDLNQRPAKGVPKGF